MNIYYPELPDCAEQDAALEAEAAYHEQLYTTAAFRANLTDQDAPFDDSIPF